jgi:large subunit ribosomal protein L30
MITVIRIRGEVKVRKAILETLDRLNLKKKYTCIVLEKPTEIELGMINKVKDFVAFGEIDKETYKKLVEARGKQGTDFFRLHPPRKGIESKKHFGVGKGVLGNHGSEISKLLLRML